MADYKLTHLLRDSLIESGHLRTGLATGGSTTTLADTNRDPQESERNWKDGTLIVLRDSAGGGVAPEGEFGRISAFSDRVFTMPNTLTGAIAAGDRYGVAPRTVEHQMLLELSTQAVQQLGDVGVDDTSITTAANQREYPLPVALKRAPRNVYIQKETGDSNDNQWNLVDGWTTNWASAGSAGLLLFGNQPPEGRAVKIEYWDLHPSLNAFDDVISETIHPVLARKSMVERIANYLTAQAQQTDEPRRDSYNKAALELEQAMKRYPIRRPMVAPTLFTYSKSMAEWPGDPETIFS